MDKHSFLTTLFVIGMTTLALATGTVNHENSDTSMDNSTPSSNAATGAGTLNSNAAKPNINSDTNQSLINNPSDVHGKNKTGVMPPDTIQKGSSRDINKGTSGSSIKKNKLNRPADNIGTQNTGGRTDTMDTTPGSGTSTGGVSGTTQIK